MIKTKLIQAYKSNRSDVVVQLAEAILATEPSNYEAHFYLAHTYLKQNKTGQAQSLFEELIRRYPEKYQGYEGLSKVYKQLGNSCQELETWQMMLPKFPDVVHIYTNITDILIRQGQWAAAEQSSQQTINRFPNAHYGYEQAALISEKQMQWQQAYVRWNDVVTRFPKLQSAYLHWLPIHIRLYGYTSARPLFDNAALLFPQSEKIDQLHATEAEKQFDWDEAARLWQSLHQRFPTNTAFAVRYAKALRHSQGLAASQACFRALLQLYPAQFAVQKGLLETFLIEKDWQIALDYGKKILAQTLTPAQQADIYYTLRIPYNELKCLGDLERAFRHLKVHHEYLAWKGYATVAELRYNGNLADLQSACRRWKRTADLFPQHFEAKIKYGELLLSTNQLDYAEQVFSELKTAHPDLFAVWKGWCLVAHHRKNWQEARHRLLQVRLKFPSQFNSIYYYLVNTLQNGGWQDQIDSSFEWHTKSLFKDNISAHPNEYLCLGKISVARILGDYTRAEQLARESVDWLPFKDATLLPRPPRENVVRYIEHSPDNTTLVVCFSGMDGKRTHEHYRLHGLTHLDEIAVNPNDTFNYTGFATKTTQYNFLLLRDNYNSWYQIHTDWYADVIRETVKHKNISKLVMIGASAGGFAAMMFGQLLQADIVYVQSPQTLAFTSYSTHFNKALELEYNLTSGRYTDIAALQQQTGGFIPQTYVHVSENNGTDYYAVNLLDQNDEKLHLSAYPNDTHSVHLVIGKSALFKRLCTLIDNFEKEEI